MFTYTKVTRIFKQFNAKVTIPLDFLKNGRDISLHTTNLLLRGNYLRLFF